MANDLFSALKTYLSKVSSGEKSPQEMAAALNAWARESGEAIKLKVEDEVSRTVKKMGFAKQEDLDRLAREVESLKSRLVVNTTRASSSKTAKVNNSPKKKATTKQSTNKTAAKTSTKKVQKRATKKAAK